MSRFVVPADARSWVKVAEGSDFPIQNLPFGLIAPKGRNEAVAVAIGDQALDLLVLSEAGLISETDFPILDSFIELQGDSLGELRRCVFDLLRDDNPRLRDDKKLRERALVPLDKANPQVPIPPNAFVDFYSGIHHASNVGRMFRPDQPPLLPNYRWVPIGYNGRASSVVASGTPILRPKGQRKPPDADVPVFGPSASLDFELEMGFYLAEGTQIGKRITCAAAEDHMLGLVIVNDWSARDFQAWEYQPLGPFLSKNFATTISPWVVTMEALAPFRRPFAHPPGDPAPLPYLDSAFNRDAGAIDIVLEVWLQSAQMRERGLPAQRLMQSNFRDAYWTLAQMLAHHTVNGCNLQPGDLLGTGTQSGPGPDEGGSLLELTQGGRQPIMLASGETRTFLADGDTVILRAHCAAPGARRIGFGACAGTVAG